MTIVQFTCRKYDKKLLCTHIEQISRHVVFEERHFKIMEQYVTMYVNILLQGLSSLKLRLHDLKNVRQVQPRHSPSKRELASKYDEREYHEIELISSFIFTKAAKVAFAGASMPAARAFSTT